MDEKMDKPVNDQMVQKNINKNLWVDILIVSGQHIMGEMTVAAYEEAVVNARHNDLLNVEFTNRSIVIAKQHVIAFAHRNIQEMIDEEERLVQEKKIQEAMYRKQYPHREISHGTTDIGGGLCNPTPGRFWGSII